MTTKPHYPALLVSEDGWVELLSDPADIASWSFYAVSKYQGASIIIFDSSDSALRVKSISSERPLNLLNKLLAETIYNPEVKITMGFEKEKAPLQATLELLEKAIDADDDCLTQWTEAEELKEAIRKANSFKSLVGIL